MLTIYTFKNKAMKRKVIFFVLLRTSDSLHDRMAVCDFTIFDSNLKLLKNFNKWVLEKKQEVEDEYQKDAVVENLKIIR